MLFDGWAEMGRVCAVGAAAYLVLLVELRTAGKRTLAKLNAFDLVVTVALGSALATIALSQDVSLAEGAAAITLLVAAQWTVAWLSVHTPLARRTVRADATVVFEHGRFDDTALVQTRLLRSEIEQAIRAGGCGDLEMVAAVVLETDGSLSVVPVEHFGSGSALPASPPSPTRPGRGDSEATSSEGDQR
jgi:uncharacterized membrane protein YcaP (DUF421 family)